MRALVVLLGGVLLASLGCAAPPPPPRPANGDLEVRIPPSLAGVGSALVTLAYDARPSLVRIQSDAQILKPLKRYLLGLAHGLANLVNPHPYWEWPYRVVALPFYLIFGHFDLSSIRGSGFFVTPELVLTNAHVVENAAKILLQLTDGRTAKARVLAEDVERDLALLEVLDLRGDPPPFLELRQAGYAPGEVVMAMGFPGRDGLDDPFMSTFTLDEDKLVPNPRITVGVLSAADVELGNLRTRYLETDAALNPGNSGGPVLGLDGRVMGVAVMIGIDKENEGYAVPSHSVLEAFPDHLQVTQPASKPTAAPGPSK